MCKDTHKKSIFKKKNLIYPGIAIWLTHSENNPKCVCPVLPLILFREYAILKSNWYANSIAIILTVVKMEEREILVDIKMKTFDEQAQRAVQGGNCWKIIFCIRIPKFVIFDNMWDNINVVTNHWGLSLKSFRRDITPRPWIYRQ